MYEISRIGSSTKRIFNTLNIIIVDVAAIVDVLTIVICLFPNLAVLPQRR